MFKVLSDSKGIYRPLTRVKLLVMLVSAFIFIIGLMNVYFADGNKDLPIWATGFFCWLGWVGLFTRYHCQFDLAKGEVRAKASSLFPIFERRYNLAQVKGFRALARTGMQRDYCVYMVLNNNTHVVIANLPGRAIAASECEKIAEFTQKPLEINLGQTE
ncbi:hypothetical protein [Thalassotalea marina]|uniref:Uncharacterized protein n=1 Tax=Thalassotalea marina TaxID=1673741 RepID=A0A919EGX2_9GAMM|nr:hypothetical protein [Thalassotalea marina]GHF77932.1 hypothetical protein GCM10017161_01190 [Thalassotalea marina]